MCKPLYSIASSNNDNNDDDDDDDIVRKDDIGIDYILSFLILWLF